MEIFGLALSMLGLVVLGALAVALVVAVTLDRNGRAAPKWVIFLGGLGIMSMFVWDQVSFTGLYEQALSFSTWKPVLYYLGIGLLYSALEFTLGVRRAAEFFSEQWKKFYNSSFAGAAPVSHSESDIFGKGATIKTVVARSKDALGDGTEEELAENKAHIELAKFWAKRLITKFCENTSFYRARFIHAELKEEELEIEPKVNRLSLSRNIGSWAFFWPFYAISLILGDLLNEVFKAIADFFVRLSSRFVRLQFANVFKF
jgi:hypothetical protein